MRESDGTGSIDNLPESSRRLISGLDRITGNGVIYTPLKKPTLQRTPGDSCAKSRVIDIDYRRKHLIVALRVLSTA